MSTTRLCLKRGLTVCRASRFSSRLALPGVGLTPVKNTPNMSIQVWADVGGTFTDCIVTDTRGNTDHQSPQHRCLAMRGPTDATQTRCELFHQRPIFPMDSLTALSCLCAGRRRSAGANWDGRPVSRWDITAADQIAKSRAELFARTGRFKSTCRSRHPCWRPACCWESRLLSHCRN